MKKSLIVQLSIMAMCIFISACSPELRRAVKETIIDTSKEVDEEYGKGVKRSTYRGTEGIISIDPYRSKINNLYSDRKITRADRDKRLDSLFSSYDAYKSGRISRNDFERHAKRLTIP